MKIVIFSQLMEDTINILTNSPLIEVNLVGVHNGQKLHYKVKSPLKIKQLKLLPANK